MRHKDEETRSYRAYAESRRRFGRFVLLVTAAFTWTMVVGPAFAGLSPQPPSLAARRLAREGGAGHTRRLSKEEMRHIVGGLHAISVSEASGPTYPWEGSVNNTNTGNGNKLTSVPIVGWTARGGMPVQMTLYHNAQGNHNSELGQKWTFSYDIYGLVDGSHNFTVHWGNDLAYPFAATPIPRSANFSYTAPTGIHDGLISTLSGSTIVSYDLTTKDQIKYHFTNPNGTGWYCVSISDRNGNTITINHNTSDYVTTIVDPTGRTLTLTMTSGKISSISDAQSRSWSISYNGSSELTQVTWPTVGGNSYNEQFAYDAGGHHDIVTWTDKRGHSRTATYNSADDSLASETDECGNTTTWSEASGATTISDANGHSIVHNYSSGRLSSVTDQLSNSESYSYDASNNRTGITDRRGHASSFTFDSMGNMLTKTDELSHTWTWTYTSKNDPATLFDPLSHEAQWGYDASGNLTSMTDGLGHVTSYTVDAHGLRTAEVDSLTHETDFGYNTDGELTSVTDANSHTTSYTVNTLGVRTGMTDALTHATSYSLDNWNRVTSVNFANSTSIGTGYDANSNVTSVTDQNSHTTSTFFDNDDRPTSVTNGRGDVVSYSYDGTGQKGLLSSKTDGNTHTTSYSYTARNQVSSVSYPDSTSESFSYDANENLASHTDCNGHTISYTRDNADRLTGITYPSGTNPSFSYDNANRRTGMTDSTGSTSWVYDAADRLTSCTTPIVGGGTNTVAYTFDNANRRTGVTLNTSTSWSYSFDAGNRLTGLTNPYSESTAWTYDAANRVTQVTNGNTAVTTMGYDTVNRTTDVWHKTSGGTTLGRYQYTFDSAGNVTERDDNDGSTTAFGYDNANQLTSEARTNSTANYSISYTYDHNANRTSKTIGGVTDTYSYSSHDHLTSTSSKGFSYDSNGNLASVTTGGATTTLSYDYENRLTGITYPSTATNSFKYNALGLRAQKVDSSGTVNYVCDGTAPASAVLADTNATYTPGLSERRGGTSKFYHGDSLGSTRGITNSSQTATDGILYDAFGMTVSRTGTTPTPFGFVGAGQYQTDADSGLMLLGHRYYDASVGRFITSDPAQAGDNWYAYCENNPLGGTDAEGLDASPVPGNELPHDRLKYKPPFRGAAPIGDDGSPIELHHRNQKPDGPIDEMTRRDHRGKGNHKRNHPLPNQGVDHGDEWRKYTKNHWKNDWDNGRFKDLPDEPTVSPITNVIANTGDIGLGAGAIGTAVIAVPVAIVVGPWVWCCFESGTPVLLADGSLKPIQEIRPGDRVLTRNGAGDRLVSAIVLRTTVTEADEMITLRFAGGEEIRVTPNHLFFVPGAGFVRADELGAGCRFSSLRGEPILLSQVTRSKGRKHVYNLVVGGVHSFMVGKGAYWVRDASPPLSR